ncbi:alpha/beta hydrolase family protein [Nocardiopsis coralliicola]
MTDALSRMTRPDHPERRRLTTADGVGIDSVLLRGGRPTSSAVVVANGFTGTWRSRDTRMIARRLLTAGDVLLFDFRGHYDSDGMCTVGNDEVLDLEAAVGHLRGLGYDDISAVGFSMGAAVVVRHAGSYGGLSAAVSVSGPSRWYYRGTRSMRLLHFGVEHPVGRWFLRTARNVRVVDREWDPVPPDPTELAAAVAPTPLLVMHGDSDGYFPLEHPRRIYEAAGAPKDLWIESGMGHAEGAMTIERADRIAGWLAEHRISTAA